MPGGRRARARRRRFRRRPEDQRSLAAAYGNLGTLCVDGGQFKEAEAAFQQACIVWKALATSHPGVVEHHEYLGVGYHNLAYLQRKTGRATEAAESYQQALIVYQNLAADHPKVLHYQNRVATTHTNLGTIYRELGQLPRAEQANRNALAIFAKLAASHPDLPEYRVKLGALQGNLGILLADANQHPAALKSFDQAIETLTPLLRTEREAPGYLGNAYRGKASTLTKLGRYSESVASWRRALELETGSNRALVLLNLACALGRAGDHAAAVAEAEQLEKNQASRGTSPYHLARIYSLASLAVARDSALPETDRNKQADRYAGRALDYLGKAAAAGYFKHPANLARLKKDPDLDALRSHEVFKQLIAD